MTHCQGQGIEMGMMAPSANFPIAGDSRFYYFTGSAMSLQCRLETMSDQEISNIIDANLTITGIEIKPNNTMCEMCTFIWGSIIILPLLLVCFNPWKRCVHAAYDIPESVYRSLSKLINGPNMRNLTINITDNLFDRQKAQILFQMVERSGLRGLTLINSAGGYDFNG
jgi:hypothetical protein